MGQLFDIWTVICIIIMTGVLLYDRINYRGKIKSITFDLKRVTSMMLNQSEDKFDFFKENPFANQQLIEMYYRFSEQRKLKSGWKSDIEDFINEETRDAAVSRQISSIVPGIMTGLGILFTFIGLVIGLLGFNTDMEMISTSIDSLIEGIKTAFITSIFGVSISLIYNWSYNKLIDENNRTIREFYFVYRRCVEADSETLIMEKMIKAQEEQTAALNSVSVKLADVLADGMADIVTKSVKNNIEPVMKSLSKSLDDYIMKAVEAQSQTLQKIVNKFLHNLNETMGDQFERLRDAMESMCVKQEHTVSLLSGVTSDLDNMSKHLSKVNTDMERIDRERDDMLRTVREVQEISKHHLDNFSEYAKKTNDYIDMLKNEATIRNESFDEFAKVIEEKTQPIREFYDSIEKLYVSFAEMLTELNAYNLNIDNLGNGIQQTLNSTNNLVSQMKNDWSAHSKVMMDSVHGYSEMVDKIGKLGTNFEVTVKEAAKNLEETPKLINDMIAKNKEVIGRLPAQYRESIENQTAALEQILKRNNRIVEYITHLLRKDNA